MVSYLIGLIIVAYSGWILTKVIKKRIKGDCCHLKNQKMKERKEGEEV